MHGPKPRSHAFKVNKKVRRLGLKIALSARAAEGKVSFLPHPWPYSPSKIKIWHLYIILSHECTFFLNTQYSVIFQFSLLEDLVSIIYK